MHRGILALALGLALTLPAQAEYTFRPFNSGGGSGIGTVNGIVKGDGAGNPSQAVAGTDYVSPALTSGRIYVGSAGNLATGVPMGGDCTIVAAGTITCTKTNGVAFGAFATATDAANLSGTVASGRISGNYGGITGVGTITSGAWNGTVGATTPSTIAATAGTFSGILTAANSLGANSQGVLSLTNSSTGVVGGIFGNSGANSVSAINFSTDGGATSGSLGLLTYNAGVAGTRLFVNKTGNVGIGTITPSAKLEVSDSAGALVDLANLLTPGMSNGQKNFVVLGNSTANNNGFYLAYNHDSTAANRFVSLQATEVGVNGGIALTAPGNVGIGTSAPAAQLHTTGTVRFAGIPSVATPGCLANDAAGNVSGGNACSGGGMPAGGALGQAPLNSAAGTALWRTEPAVNFSALTGADCTGAVATVISTVIGSIKSIALPTDCTLKVTGNDTIPAGVFFAIPCGARVQVDGAAVLTFNAETDDNECQKFTASGAGAGAGGGIVKGLRFNRPEWWGAAGDCNYGGACTHDDFGPLQQAFNSAQASNASSGGQRAQVKFGCGKGYGVSTGVVATATRNAPLLISGCAPLSGGNSEAGSALYGRTGFAGIVLTVTGNTSTNIEIRDFEISSINNFQADVCLQIGSAGNTLGNNSGHSFAHNLRLTYCKHLLKFAGSVVSFQFDRIWMVMGNNGSTSGANASCIEAVPNAEVLSELTFNAIACDGAPNSDASAICLNFHSQGGSGGISGTRIFDVSCYQPTTGLLIQADGASSIPDFWCYSCQMDGMRVNSRAFSLVTTGTATLADIVIDKSYSTNLAAPFDIFNIDGSAGGTIKNVGIYGPYIAVGGALRGFRVTDAQSVQIQGGRIGGTFTQQGALVNNCAGCMVNNHIFSGTVPVFALLGGSTDYSQACNNTASGALAPASVSASVAAGTHNIYFGSAYQVCPNN